MPASSPTDSAKRPADDDNRALSPPPLKRRAQSAVSKSAFATFFTPTSQKPKNRTTWSEIGADPKLPATLLVGSYIPEGQGQERLGKRKKIAAFDLDSTLITTASGKKHGDAATDWKWWDSSVPVRLRQLYNDEGYLVTIFTNQAGLQLHPDSDPKAKGPKNAAAAARDRVTAFKQKCGAILAHLDIPLKIYAATGRDIFRKPRTGMWTELMQDHELEEGEVNLTESMLVGDAGGRIAAVRGGSVVQKDFSCSDRNLASNIGLRYLTPEEFFLGEPARDFARDFDLAKYPYDAANDVNLYKRKNKLDIVLFCGPPGAGKSTFYWNYLKPLGYERVNQDILKSRAKCLEAASLFLSQNQPVAVDNTNADVDVRADWISLARQRDVPIRCVLFKTPVTVAEHNAAVRALNCKLNPENRDDLPKLAFNSFASRYRAPKLSEGFQDIVELDFKFRGTKEEYDVWGRYWV